MKMVFVEEGKLENLQISFEERQMAEYWGYISSPLDKNWKAQPTPSFKFRFFKGFEPVSLQISPEERQMAE